MDVAESEITPIPGDRFVFKNVKKAGRKSWMLINFIVGPSDEDIYVFKSEDGELLELPVETVMKASDSGKAVYSSHIDDYDQKGIAIHLITPHRTVDIIDFDNNIRSGIIIVVDAAADSFTVEFPAGESETFQFGDAGLLPDGIKDIQVGEEIETPESDFQTAISDSDEANMVEIDIIQELEDSLKTFTQEEQEQAFINAWVQHPLPGHPASLVRGRFALLDFFRNSVNLLNERIQDELHPDIMIRLRNAAIQPFPLMPISNVETVVYIEPTKNELVNVKGLHISNRTASEDVRHFVSNLMSSKESTMEGKHFDTLIRDMFEHTMPWIRPDSDDNADDNVPKTVLRDTDFLRISTTFNQIDDSTHILRTGAWMGVTERVGSQNIKVFVSHHVAVSEQRAVAGRTRKQPISGNIVSSMIADKLATNGYMYIPPQSIQTDWITPNKTKILLYDIRRSRPHYALDRSVLFSNTSSIPLLKTTAEIKSANLNSSFIFDANNIDEIPTLVNYIASFITTDSPFIYNWHELYTYLSYVGYDTQSLATNVSDIISTKIEQSISGWESHLKAIDAAAATFTSSVSPRFGYRDSLALLNYANPLDDNIRGTLPPEIIGLPHWGGFKTSHPEAWVKIGFLPAFEKYWIAKINQDNIAAGEALKHAKYAARKINRNLMALQQNVVDLGHPRAEHNPCPHVPFIDKVMTEMRDESDTDWYMKAIKRILSRYGGKRVADWVHCLQCKKTLVCAHDLMLIDAREHPEDLEIIHKRLVLKFGQHAIEGRSHMCGNCGMTWALSDFDADPLVESAGDMEIEDIGTEDVNEDWAVAEGYDNMWTDEAEEEAEKEEAASITVAAEAGIAIANEADEAEEFLEKSKTPLSKYPAAKRIIGDIAGLAGITITDNAEEKLLELHTYFPRRPVLRGRPAADIELSVLRYIARFAACILTISRNYPSVLPLQIGAALTDEEEQVLSERSFAKLLSRPNYKHAPWKNIKPLGSGEARAIHDRVDELFKQINRAMRSINTTNVVASPEGLTTTHIVDIHKKFRVPDDFKPQLLFVPANKLANSPDNDVLSTINVSDAPGTSLLEYYSAIELLFKTFAYEARHAPPVPEQMGAHYITGQPISEAIDFINTIANQDASVIAGIPHYIIEAGKIYLKKFNRSWLRSQWKVPVNLFNTDASLPLSLSIDDWRILFNKACASGPNTGLSHRFLSNNKCVYCGITKPSESHQIDVPNEEAGQALLDAIRLKNAIPDETTHMPSELKTIASHITALFPGKNLASNPVFAIFALTFGPTKGTHAENVARFAASIKALDYKFPPELENIDTLKFLCKNPYSACRDLLQFFELPLARWAFDNKDLIKSLHYIPSSYNLFTDHKRDVEHFLEQNLRHIPTTFTRSPAVVSAIIDTTKRIRALVSLRDAWSVRTYNELNERGIAEDMDIQNIVYNMFMYSVNFALAPLFDVARGLPKGGGRAIIDFVDLTIDTWAAWNKKYLLSSVSDVLLQYAETEKDELLREYESRDEDDKRILGIQKRLHIGRYEVGDVKRMDAIVYRRDASLASRLEKRIEHILR